MTPDMVLEDQDAEQGEKRWFAMNERAWCLMEFVYHGTLVAMEERMAREQKFMVERVQTGVRMEKRLLKVLKAFAEYRDLTLGDLLEGIVLHAFDGKCPFGGESLRRIKKLKKFYGLELDSRASHRLRDAGTGGHGTGV